MTTLTAREQDYLVRMAFAGIDEVRLKSCVAAAASKLIAQGGYAR